MNTSDTLNLAADLIERRGWARGPGGWSGSRLCLEGALYAALGISADGWDRLALYTCPAYAAVSDYLDLHPMPATAPVRDALWQWNDDVERTAEQVVATLRATALIEAAKETADRRVEVSA